MSNAIYALVIDGDPLSVQVLARMLDNENVTNTHLNDPAHLEQTLDEVGQLALVFLDLEMPHRDGYEVLDVLRQRLVFRGVSKPIVMACPEILWQLGKKDISNPGSICAQLHQGLLSG